MAANTNPFNRFAKNFQNYMRRWPLAISQRAVLEIKNNFQRQGFENDNGAFVRWPDRASKDKNKARRSLLIKSGRLRRSPRAAPIGYMPRVISDVPYAEALNDGFRGLQSVKPHKRTARRTTFIRGSYSGLSSLNSKGKKTIVNGARHNVRGFTRRVNLKARPFMTVGPSFLNKEEARFFDELETLFLQS